jgi:hypothetical protein
MHLHNPAKVVAPAAPGISKTRSDFLRHFLGPGVEKVDRGGGLLLYEFSISALLVLALIKLHFCY